MLDSLQKDSEENYVFAHEPLGDLPPCVRLTLTSPITLPWYVSPPYKKVTIDNKSRLTSEELAQLRRLEEATENFCTFLDDAQKALSPAELGTGSKIIFRTDIYQSDDSINVDFQTPTGDEGAVCCSADVNISCIYQKGDQEPITGWALHVYEKFKTPWIACRLLDKHMDEFRHHLKVFALAEKIKTLGREHTLATFQAERRIEYANRIFAALEARRKPKLISSGYL
jgi:hypothetical protein